MKIFNSDKVKSFHGLLLSVVNLEAAYSFVLLTIIVKISNEKNKENIEYGVHDS